MADHVPWSGRVAATPSELARRSATIRVLVVDDQEPVRRGLEALLESCEGIQVSAKAADGREAIELVAHAVPDLVLMDCRMPGMDGLEATRHLKREHPRIPVLALSMYPALRGAAEAAGADGFLVKGCGADELVESIQALVTRFRRERG